MENNEKEESKITLKLKTDSESDSQKKTSLSLAGVNEKDLAYQSRNEKKDPWDFSEEIEQHRISNQSNQERREFVEEKKSGESLAKTILILGEVFMYLSVLVTVICYIWIGRQDLISIYDNLLKCQPILTGCLIVLAVDAVLVNLFYGRRIRLFFWLLLFPFMYPSARCKFVRDGGGMGSACSVIEVIATIFLVYAIGRAVMMYGSLLTTGTEVERKTALVVMEQVADNGWTLGQIFQAELYLEGVTLEEGQATVTIHGQGRIYTDGTTLVQNMTQNIPTDLTFTKVDGQYELTKVVLNGAELNEMFERYYWAYLMTLHD